MYRTIPTVLVVATVLACSSASAMVAPYTPTLSGPWPDSIDVHTTEAVVEVECSDRGLRSASCSLIGSYELDGPPGAEVTVRFLSDAQGDIAIESGGVDLQIELHEDPDLESWMADYEIGISEQRGLARPPDVVDIAAADVIVELDDDGRALLDVRLDASPSNASAYAWAAGADVVFFHQLFDDCGDQPAGTDFAYHTGELCIGSATCFGDAFGLYRNENSSICYAQHPEPGTARPAASAFELLASVFGTEAFENPRQQRIANNRVQVIAFERPATSERVYVIWNREFEPLTFELPANSDSARPTSEPTRQRSSSSPRS